MSRPSNGHPAPQSYVFHSDFLISLKKKYDGYVAALENLKYIYDVVNDRNLDLKDSIKALSDELSKWKRNRDLVTGRFIKNRK